MCGLSPLSLLIRGERSDKGCLKWEGGGVSPDDRTAGRAEGKSLALAPLLVLIGVHRKVSDKRGRVTE